MSSIQCCVGGGVGMGACGKKMSANNCHLILKKKKPDKVYGSLRCGW